MGEDVPGAMRQVPQQGRRPGKGHGACLRIELRPGRVGQAVAEGTVMLMPGLVATQVFQRAAQGQQLGDLRIVMRLRPHHLRRGDPAQGQQKDREQQDAFMTQDAEHGLG